jgi:serine/threonine-protein kinase
MVRFIGNLRFAGGPYLIAVNYAYRGEPDAAFEWLERAYRGRDSDLTKIKIDERMTSMHNDPRYKALLRKMNLPE